MAGPRPVALSMFPEVVADKAVGPLVASVQEGLNGDLIHRVAPLYLHGASVMDVTYGRGLWWTRYRPADLVAHDLDVDGVDFRALPEADGSVDVVCFDPPYIPQGGVETSTQPDFVARFGLQQRGMRELWALIDDGLAECARVARRWVLVKCCDYTNGGQLRLGHVRVIQTAEAIGLRVHDLIVHVTGSGPGGHNIFEQVRARRHHSYLLVLDAGGGLGDEP